jgi:hypothetical protein
LEENEWAYFTSYHGSLKPWLVDETAELKTWRMSNCLEFMSGGNDGCHPFIFG